MTHRRRATEMRWVPSKTTRFAMAVAIGMHVVFGGLAFVLLRFDSQMRVSRPAPNLEQPQEHLTFVEPRAEPAPRPQRVTVRASDRRRTDMLNTPALPSMPTVSTVVGADVPAKGVAAEGESAVLEGARPRFADPRVWSPPTESRATPTPSTPAVVINDALTRAVDSSARITRTGKRAAGDWSITTARGSKWGWDAAGIWINGRGLAVQPPAPTDLERARMSARADIQRFAIMTPGDSAFDQLKAELRQRREQSRGAAARPPNR